MAKKYLPSSPRDPVPQGPDSAALAALAQAEADAAAGRREIYLGTEDCLSPSQGDDLRRAIVERARRKMEALRLYQPLNAQLQFHFSGARVRLLRGSNRGGKTLPAAVEVARAVTGQDPSGKYPLENGRCFLIGKDLKHCGDVMWRKLGRPGAFKMIRDRASGDWRAYRPWSEEDRQREQEAKPVPPLIPHRLIKEIGWENKKEGIPAIVRLHNGWELNFFSSLGKPPQGSDIDLCWLDEEIIDEDWVPEMLARILDRRGKVIWSATPQAGTDQLYELHERSLEERKKTKPQVEEYIILLEDNPYIGQEEKEAFGENLTDEDRRVRIGGEFALTSFKIYPEFSMLVHGADWQEIPNTWCRYMIVDPGHQVCACLFLAVPPPDFGDLLYLYDELYVKECDAAKFALNVSYKTVGHPFQAFVMDPNAALITDMGTGKSVGQQYSEQLAARKIFSAATGNNFLLASDNIEAGLLAVHHLLRRRENNRPPRLRVLRNAVPNFEWEIKRYHKRRVNGVVSDKPDSKRHSHLMDCLRYAAMSDLRFVEPPKRPGPLQGALPSYRAKQARQKAKNGGDFIRLGPGTVMN